MTLDYGQGRIGEELIRVRAKTRKERQEVAGQGRRPRPQASSQPFRLAFLFTLQLGL